MRLPVTFCVQVQKKKFVLWHCHFWKFSNILLKPIYSKYYHFNIVITTKVINEFFTSFFFLVLSLRNPVCILPLWPVTFQRATCGWQPPYWMTTALLYSGLHHNLEILSLWASFQGLRAPAFWAKHSIRQHHPYPKRKCLAPLKFCCCCFVLFYFCL